MIPFYAVSKIAKSVETESGLVVFRDWRRGWNLLASEIAKGYWFILGGNKNFLILILIVHESVNILKTRKLYTLNGKIVCM